MKWRNNSRDTLNIIYMAEREGFEPSEGITSFAGLQTCGLSHSPISPENVSLLNFIFKEKNQRLMLTLEIIKNKTNDKNLSYFNKLKLAVIPIEVKNQHYLNFHHLKIPYYHMKY